MAICLFCKTEFEAKRNTSRKYCNNHCQGQHTAQKVVLSWLANPCPETFYTKGNIVRGSIRTALIQKAGCKCTRCGWGEMHHSAKLPALEIEHINGNWLDCSPSNIDIICPNCHSLTDTYKARNLGKGRDYRRK